MKFFPVFTFCLLLVLLAACNSQTLATATAIPTKSATLTVTKSPTESPTPTASKTQPPAFTPSKTPRPSPTPTFDVRTIVTRTPAPRAQCPTVQADKVPNFTLNTPGTIDQFHTNVLDFLNAGGSPQAIIKLYQPHTRGRIDNDAQIIDLTGDNVPDLLLVVNGDSSAAYICANGQYQKTDLMAYTYHFITPSIFKIKDINRDGIPEVIFQAGDLRFRFYTVNEWDGSGFKVLNEDTVNDSCSTLMGESTMETLDTGKTLELILKQGIPIWSEYSGGVPWRKETRTCTWDGTSFTLTNTQFAPPELRFQAVQDGDRATLAGEYDKALAFYQQAIFDDKLSWWSLKRHFEAGNALEDLKPTPDPSTLDPAEYPNLAAYSYFRIMLLYIKRGFLPEAKTVHNTLQQKYPIGQPGHAYAEMATFFMEEYISSQSLAQACGSAISYATAHPIEILAYLGNGESSKSFFGDQSLEYTPASICPFVDDRP